MIGVVATVRVNEGKAEIFEEVFRETMAAVRAEEPGTLVYQLTRSRTDPNVYKMLEFYQDQAALDLHVKNNAARAVFARLEGCLAGRPDIEYLDAVL